MKVREKQIEKLFDVACTLIDVMSCVPLEAPSTSFGVSGPTDYLNYLVHLISTLRSGASRYLELIVAKIKDTLPPHMAASIAQPQPLTPIKAEQPSTPESSTTPFLQHADSVSSEYHSSSASSPYSTPPFKQWYPPL